MEPGLELVVIARLGKARGLRGELASVPLSDDPERVKRVYVNAVPLQVERTWWHQDKLIFKFEGIDSMTEAGKLQGFDVCIPKEERAALPDGEYYQTDLIGCEVVNLDTGKAIGVVEDWQEFGGPPLLQIRADDGREILIPFAKAICTEIDPAGRRLGVKLPEGLTEL